MELTIAPMIRVGHQIAMDAGEAGIGHGGVARPVERRCPGRRVIRQIDP
jgi:hypothetical protein